MPKRKGSYLDFTEARNRDLLRAFRHCLQVADRLYLPDILEKVANMEASRFWVSEERAFDVISDMLAGRPYGRMRHNKLQMFSEILRRVKIRLQSQSDKEPLKLSRIIREVIEEPAPRFYMTPRTIGQILYKIKKGFYDNRRYNHSKPITPE